mgnify:CR=1 FL=1
MKILGPFKQIITLDHLPLRGKISDDQLEIIENGGIVVENGKKQKTGEFEALTDMPLPKAKNIIDYTIAQGKDSNFAFKLLEQRIIDLFIHYNVTRTFYEKRRADFHTRIKQIYLPIYFAIIKSDKIIGAHKKIETQLTKLYSKIDKLYRI